MKIKEIDGADKIGRYNYAHWAGSPITPGTHELKRVPQTMFDSFEGYCSCGEWAGSGSFHDYTDRDQLLADLKAAHVAHATNSDVST